MKDFYLLFAVFIMFCSGKAMEPFNDFNNVRIIDNENSPDSKLLSIAFDQYEIELGDEKYQTILFGDLLGGSHSEISVTTRDSLGNISLYIYSYENEKWTKTMESELSKEILFVDIANIAGRDRLIFYEQGNFSWFDTEKMVTRDLLSFSFNYTGKLKDRIPWVNMNFDLNNDTFDDFIIPAV